MFPHVSIKVLELLCECCDELSLAVAEEGCSDAAEVIAELATVRVFIGKRGIAAEQEAMLQPETE